MGPIFRWAGSKRQLVPRLRAYWGTGFHRYIEPFAGSACLFFDLQPPSAVISDINSDLIATYRLIRWRPTELYLAISGLPTGKSAYNDIRALKPDTLSAVERAARFLYLNRFCFNGIYRTNGQGTFNVPYGGAKSGQLPSRDALSRAARALRKADLIAGDFAQIVERTVQSGDFVYLDPPYAVRNRRVFRQYGPQSFGTDDIARLAKILDVINDRGATFLLSYAACPYAAKHLAKWRRRRYFVQRHIAGFCGNRRRAAEILYTNDAIAGTT